MEIPKNLNWIHPNKHESLLHSTQVKEIKYSWLFTYIIVSTLWIVLTIQINKGLATISPALVLIIFFPLIIKPWDIVVTNKRVIYRTRYWDISRFSTVKSINLQLVESVKISPFLKLKSLILGFSIIQIISVPMFNFSLTGRKPSSIYVDLLIYLGEVLGYLDEVDERWRDFILNNFSFIFPTIQKFVIIITFISFLLIIFGFPRKNDLTIITTGGNQIRIKVGMPKEIIETLLAIVRLNRIKPNPDSWDWDVPLLDGENILAKGRIGIIDKKSQILGILSLYLALVSIRDFINLITHPNLLNLILFFIQLLQFTFIWFSIVFAKRYQRIVTTNYRVISQEERNLVSGLWGKRIYYYTDLPFDKVQGFDYSSYSGVTQIQIMKLLIIIYFIINFSPVDLLNFGYNQVIILILILTFLLFNIKTYGNLTFHSIGGSKVSLTYQLPYLLARFSHSLERRHRIYNRFFPNIISDIEVANLINSVRNVVDPVNRLNPNVKHKITYLSFIDKDEKILETWKKLGPHRYTYSSIIIGLLLGIVMTVYLYSNVKNDFELIFMILSLIIQIIIGARKFLLMYRTLIITTKRIILVNEVLPRKIAAYLGILPRMVIREVDRKHVLSSDFRLYLNNTSMLFIKQISIFIAIIILLKTDLFIQNNFFNEFLQVIVIILDLVLIALSPLIVSSFFNSIPRYSLFIKSRYNEFIIPYINKLENIVKLQLGD